jgi:hypothetical protein
MLGVRCQSWAQWLAGALDLPYTGLAENGAVAADVLARQVPRLRGPYAVACVYAGVNDVRRDDFEAAAYRACLGAVLEAVGRQAGRLVVASIPHDLGRPPAPPARIAEANRAIVELAGAAGAAVVDLSDLRGWKLVLPDAVHLTALGQLHLAARAAAALGAPSPATLVAVGSGPGASARYALSGYAVAVARDRVRRARESQVRWVQGTVPEPAVARAREGARRLRERAGRWVR